MLIPIKQSLLVIVNSTVKNQKEGVHERIRESWVREFRQATASDVVFTLGDPLYQFGRDFLQLQRDERVLATPDDKDVSKVRTACKWMLSKRYSHVLFVPVEAVVKPSVLKSGFHRFDYSGHVELGRVASAETFPFVDPTDDTFYQAAYPWVQSRYGIFLSRDAAEVVAREIPKTAQTDFFIGQVLGPEIFRAQLTAEALDIKDKHIV